MKYTVLVPSQVWDANLGQAACSFTFPDRVYGVAMSGIAATHCLIAVVGGDPHIKLCDPATGGFTHSLVGHREPVWAVSWSLDSEYHLVTGGCDGQVGVLFLPIVMLLLFRKEKHMDKTSLVSASALHYITALSAQSLQDTALWVVIIASRHKHLLQAYVICCRSECGTSEHTTACASLMSM
jgi:WD40 repeat protein